MRETDGAAAGSGDRETGAARVASAETPGQAAKTASVATETTGVCTFSTNGAECHQFAHFILYSVSMAVVPFPKESGAHVLVHTLRQVSGFVEI